MRIRNQGPSSKLCDLPVMAITHDDFHLRPGILAADPTYFFLAKQDDILACGLTSTLPEDLKNELNKSSKDKLKKELVFMHECGKRVEGWFSDIESSASEDLDEYDGYFDDVYGPLPDCPACL